MPSSSLTQDWVQFDDLDHTYLSNNYFSPDLFSSPLQQPQQPQQPHLHAHMLSKSRVPASKDGIPSECDSPMPLCFEHVAAESTTIPAAGLPDSTSSHTRRVSLLSQQLSPYVRSRHSSTASDTASEASDLTSPLPRRSSSTVSLASLAESSTCSSLSPSSLARDLSDTALNITGMAGHYHYRSASMRIPRAQTLCAPAGASLTHSPQQRRRRSAPIGIPARDHCAQAAIADEQLALPLRHQSHRQSFLYNTDTTEHAPFAPGSPAQAPHMDGDDEDFLFEFQL